MKTFGLIIALSLLLYSCNEISFREPQPAGVPALKEVPRNLQGRYLGIDNNGKDTDTLVIESWGYHLKDAKDKDWLGKGTISDSLVLKFYGNYYFVNFRTGDQWILRLLKQKPTGAIDFLSINLGDDTTKNDFLKKLSKKFVVKEVKRKGDTFYQIDPTPKQLMQLVKEGFFSGTELSRIQ